MNTTTVTPPAVAPAPPTAATRNLLLRVLKIASRIAFPIVSILGLWYLAIAFSGLPEFVIPRPTQVLAVLTQETSFVTQHLMVTLRAAAIGFLLANVVGIGLAVLFTSLPMFNRLLMPAAITIRNVPYVALASVLVLAVGDGLWTKVAIVTIAGFFPVLVNTMRGLAAVDTVVLDRMRILDVSPWKVFLQVRLPYSVPYILAAQEITGSASIIVAVAAEWMISSEGLGYVINRAMAQYRGDQVYAVALLAAVLSYAIYMLVQVIGARINWSERSRNGGK
ncbi:MAG: ABC transporter permease [Hydrogenophaga sp.]|uniref:ABC transporter permease n=1 Tax=Hydrogenophaga sp. TaxID=1904254 RepID=UPI0025BE7B29|nr:ABC transporter permease [Hydrogenophaga sp.]MBU7575992.1 ABC transporter permease [Hydrogenophaga sp.]